MQIKQRYQRFAPMFLGTREGLFPTIFAKKKKSVRIYSCGREKEREMEGGGNNKKVLEAFLIQNFIEGQK